MLLKDFYYNSQLYLRTCNIYWKIKKAILLRKIKEIQRKAFFILISIDKNVES